MIPRELNHLSLPRRGDAKRLEDKLWNAYKNTMAWRKGEHWKDYEKGQKHKRWSKWLRAMHRLQDRYDKVVGFSGVRFW